MSKRFIISSVLIVLIFLPLMLYGGNNFDFTLMETEANNGIKIDNTTLLLSSGDKKTISSLNNKEYLIINLWASWCLPCLEEIPELNTLSNNTNINILGLLVNDTKENALEIIEDFDITYPVVLNRKYVDEVLDQVTWSGIPTSIIINKNNEIISTIYGKVEEGLILKLINSLSD